MSRRPLIQELIHMSQCTDLGGYDVIWKINGESVLLFT